MENGESGDQALSETISVYDFSEKLKEQMVHFHVMKLTGGFFLWVGTSPVLSNLAVSMNSRFVSCMLMVYGETRRPVSGLVCRTRQMPDIYNICQDLFWSQIPFF